MVVENVLAWSCFAALGPRQLAVIRSPKNSVSYQNMLAEHAGSIQKLIYRKLFKQDKKDTKHTISKSTKKCLKKEGIKGY